MGEAIAANNREVAGLAEQPGIAEAVLELIDDFRSELIDPATLETRLDEGRQGGSGGWPVPTGPTWVCSTIAA